MRCHEPIENTPTETLLAWFDANLKIYREEKLADDRMSDRSFNISGNLDDIVAELGARLHPESARMKSRDEPQIYTLEVEWDDYSGVYHVERHKFRGTRTEAGAKIGDLVSVVWYSAQAAGVSGNGWDETGHAI